MKAKTLYKRDIHAIAAFFALHHGALSLKHPAPRQTNIERVVMSTFGLVTKSGPYALTPRGKRVLALAKTNPK